MTRGAFDPPVFLPADPLTTEEVQRVHDDAIARIRRAVKRHGLDPLALGLPPRSGDKPRREFEDVGQHEQPLLDFGDAREGDFFPGLKAASVQSLIPFAPGAGQQIKRLVDPDLARAAQSSGWGRQYVPPPLVVNSAGSSLHAATLVREDQEELLEKLCRYVTRPALSLKRLEVQDDGMILWTLRRARRDGTRGLVMTPYQFLARLTALIPHPREHGLTYQGLLAPASPLRGQVVPRSVVRKEVKSATESADAEDARASSGVPAEGQSYIRWADLLRRVFGVDVLRCPRCKGRRHMHLSDHGPRDGAEGARRCEERSEQDDRDARWGRHVLSCAPKGKPAHPLLSTMMERMRGAIRERMSSVVRFKAEFSRIPLRESQDPREPSWLPDPWLGGFDSVALYGMLAELNPALYVEVGSGLSMKFARRPRPDPSRQRVLLEGS